MSLEDEKLKAELAGFSAKFGPTVIYDAVVKAVDKTNATIEIEFDSGLVIDDCRLRSVIKAGSRVVFYPVTGSVVQVARIDEGQEYMCIAVAELDDVVMEVTGSIELKKGTDSLAKQLSDLIDEINKIVVLIGTSPNVAALTAIKTRINSLLK